jgi:2-polyprenyl-3-methyl-5-hydroxy-6-metoxy-1,4-benzoquinol methylase
VTAQTPLSTDATHPPCRFCKAPLRHTFVDLGMSPLCQRHVEPHQLNHLEPFYPLHVRVCEKCFLVQLEEYVSPKEIFSDYAYFSSFSDTMLAHAKAYCAAMKDRFNLGAKSLVVELASNDGYLLQYFQKLGVPVLGIEPADNVAKVAIEKGVPTIAEFFGVALAKKLAKSHGHADLMAGNNVLAHVPDINDFVGGCRVLLKPTGVVTMEFPHVMNLIDQNLFDTVYHEHFSYLGFITVQKVFAAQGLTIFDVDEVDTHGGSLRIYARQQENTSLPVTQRVHDFAARERARGFESLDAYLGFAPKVMETKRKILSFLIDAKRRGKSVAGYGAPGKGNTLLNYCGIRTDFLDYTVDRNPKKQGNYLPGTRIPILSPDAIKRTKPDYLFILPWNLKDEVIKQNAFIRDWGGQFVIPLPELTVVP